MAPLRQKERADQANETTNFNGLKLFPNINQTKFNDGKHNKFYL